MDGKDKKRYEIYVREMKDEEERISRSITEQDKTKEREKRWRNNKP